MTCALIRIEQTEKMTRQIDLKHFELYHGGYNSYFFFSPVSMGKSNRTWHCDITRHRYGKRPLFGDVFH